MSFSPSSSTSSISVSLGSLFRSWFSLMSRGSKAFLFNGISSTQVPPTSPTLRGSTRRRTTEEQRRSNQSCARFRWYRPSRRRQCCRAAATWKGCCSSRPRPSLRRRRRRFCRRRRRLHRPHRVAASIRQSMPLFAVECVVLVVGGGSSSTRVGVLGVVLG